jgi:hypothetical protein
VGGQLGALTTAESYDDAHAHVVGEERVLEHTDYAAPTGSGQYGNSRITAQTVHFDAQQAVYAHHLKLGGSLITTHDAKQ